MTQPNELLKILRDELALQTRHYKLLEAQKRALLACDRVRFCTLQEEHAKLLASLQAQEERRDAAMRDADGTVQTLGALLEGLPEKEQRRFSTVRASLKWTLAQVQTLTRQNQQMITNELDYMAFTLDLFVEAGRIADSRYGGGAGPRLLLDRRA